MTPKEKAEELLNKFKPYMYPFGAGSAYLTGDREGNRVMDDAKECALILCNELLTIIETPSDDFRFWQEVKSCLAQ